MLSVMNIVGRLSDNVAFRKHGGSHAHQSVGRSVAR